MKMIRLRAIARKELLHVVRDPRSLGLALVIPMLQLSLFGYALTLDVNNVPLIVWDQDETPVSREFISAFSGSHYFAVVGQARNYREVERATDTRLALAALVIPRGFAGKLESGDNAPAQFIVDGSDSNTAAIATGYAEGVVAGFSRLVAVRTTERVGVQMPDPPVEARPRVWFNTDMESRNFIVPGLIAIIMMLISALLAAMTVAREWENGTMEQLVSTPVRPVELILGKLIPYFAIGIADVLMVVLVGEFIFKVPLRGSVILLFSASAVFLVGALSIGIMVSTFTKNQLLANQLSMILTYVPSFLLSGFMFTVANMPGVLQAISHCLPATYFIRVLRGIYLKGVGLEVLGFEMAALAAFALLVLLVAVLGFRKKLA